jgi:dTDP-4-dehydrorhamnose reductase
MRVLILGGTGMLGHKLWQLFSQRFEAFATFRQPPANFADLFDPARSITNVSANDFDTVVRAVAVSKPDVVVNCIGIVKQDAAAKDPVQSITINALFPHRLAELCRAAGARMIHLSTDCVFSGRAGNYSEADPTDAVDLYGRTKLLGEVAGENCLTLRTSMIGRELAGAHGLVEWFLSQEGKTVKGFRHAVFSGFTTQALAETIAWIIESQPDVEGVWHVAAEAINKFDLLSLIKERGRLSIEIEPDDAFLCDRSLNAARFRQATGFVPPTWSDMISKMFQDSTPYKELRRSRC